MPACLLTSLARVGAAAVEVTGPAGVLGQLRLAEAGQLDEVGLKALAGELDGLARLLADRGRA